VFTPPERPCTRYSSLRVHGLKALYDIRASHVQVAELKDQILGVAQMTVKESLAELDKLFVEPALLRPGAGRCSLNGPG
jgi:hypothetical protein